MATSGLGQIPDGEAISVHTVRSRQELELAFGLVHDNYADRGYIEPQDSGLWLTHYNFLPGALTLVGSVDSEVVATISVFADSALCLPMDEVYHRELGKLRQEGRTLSEVGMLADRRLRIGRTLPMLLRLMKKVFDYAQRDLAADDLCIAVNPRHGRFYEQFLLFETMGRPRAYPRMRSNPAVARRMCLSKARDLIKSNKTLSKHFSGKETPRSFFTECYQPTAADVRYFLCDRTKAWQGLNDITRKGILKAVPGLASLLLEGEI